MKHDPQLPASLWAATAAPAPQTPPLEGEHRADVVVVDGGFTGLSTALHLAEHGVRVVVLEQAEPGWGASGRNGGQVVPLLKQDPDTVVRLLGPERGERFNQVALQKVDLLFDLIKRHNIDCDAELVGVGFNRRGITMGTMMGKMMAERLTGTTPDAIDVPITSVPRPAFLGLRVKGLEMMMRVSQFRDLFK